MTQCFLCGDGDHTAADCTDYTPEQKVSMVTAASIFCDYYSDMNSDWISAKLANFAEDLGVGGWGSSEEDEDDIVFYSRTDCPNCGALLEQRQTPSPDNDPTWIEVFYYRMACPNCELE